MKLACCLLACDGNPDYLDFYPLVRDAWKTVVGLDVRLALVADAVPQSLRRFEDEIVLFAPVDGVHTAFQAQCIRLLMPSLMHREFDDAVVVSDIDMLPMSRRYFTHTIRHVPADRFVIYRAGVLDHLGQFPICYNAAAPTTWSEIFPGLRDMGDIANLISEWWVHASDYRGIREGRDWATDQQRLFGAVARWSAGAGAGRLARLGDRACRFRRLDRGDPARFARSVTTRTHLIRTGYFADCHLMQPPGEYAALNREAARHASGPASLLDRLRVLLKR